MRMSKRSLFSVLLAIFIFFILMIGQSNAGVSYNVINTKDISYANIKRGIIRVRINDNQIPSESTLKHISKEVWKENRGNWQIGTVFFFVKGMSINYGAYAGSEFQNIKITKFWISDSTLKLHKYLQNKNKETIKQEPKQTAKIEEKGGLEIGKQYILKKRTPLMPSPEAEKGVDGLIRSLKKMIYLDSSDVMLVTMKKTINSTLWYQIVAYRADGGRIGIGWINSIALMGQNIVE